MTRTARPAHRRVLPPAVTLVHRLDPHGWDDRALPPARLGSPGLLASASLALRAVPPHDVAVADGVLVFVAGLLVAGPIALTALGAHRRGRGNGAAVVCALVFPFTWVAWYLVDERPYSR